MPRTTLVFAAIRAFPGTGQQKERLKQAGLAGIVLAGDEVDAAQRIDFKRVEASEIPYLQARQHDIDSFMVQVYRTESTRQTCSSLLRTPRRVRWRECLCIHDAVLPPGPSARVLVIVGSEAKRRRQSADAASPQMSRASNGERRGCGFVRSPDEPRSVARPGRGSNGSWQ